jgi:hypothetical protein
LAARAPSDAKVGASVSGFWIGKVCRGSARTNCAGRVYVFRSALKRYGEMSRCVQRADLQARRNVFVSQVNRIVACASVRWLLMLQVYMWRVGKKTIADAEGKRRSEVGRRGQKWAIMRWDLPDPSGRAHSNRMAGNRATAGDGRSERATRRGRASLLRLKGGCGACALWAPGISRSSKVCQWELNWQTGGTSFRGTSRNRVPQSKQTILENKNCSWE